MKNLVLKHQKFYVASFSPWTHIHVSHPPKNFILMYKYFFLKTSVQTILLCKNLSIIKIFIFCRYVSFSLSKLTSVLWKLLSLVFSWVLLLEITDHSKITGGREISLHFAERENVTWEWGAWGRETLSTTGIFHADQYYRRVHESQGSGNWPSQKSPCTGTRWTVFMCPEWHAHSSLKSTKLKVHWHQESHMDLSQSGKCSA